MMKYVLLSLLFTYSAVAGLPPTSTRGSAGGGYQTTFQFDFPYLPKTQTGTNAAFGQVPLATGVSGILPIANGGTSQSSKAAAFDALSPMTSSGDILYGGSSGTGTRLGKGSDGQILSLVSGIPAWVNNGSAPLTLQFGGSSEPSECTAATCTIYRQSGNVSSVTYSGSGIYTINFTAPYANNPTCIFTSRISPSSSRTFNTTSNTGSYIQGTVYNGSNSTDTGGFSVVCF